MSKPRVVTIEGNEAAAHVAYRLSEICAIYPISGPITRSPTCGGTCR
jgi:pyruvate/2-oxoacid:ferredoxin oxidoreductase alpha subunit